jgi:hypothetical protein
VKNGDPCHSDHRPVIVTMDEDCELGSSSTGPQLRFEANWVQEENCEAVVEIGDGGTIGAGPIGGAWSGCGFVGLEPKHLG